MNESAGKPVFEGEVLLCEDNSMNQEFICGRLAKMGLVAVTAQNGKEGVEQVKRRIQNGIKPFDLIFMDIYMPVMNGIEAAQEIGKLNAGIPIIAMTANSTAADRKHYTECGMPDCLNKPFTSQELLDCLVKYLNPVGGGNESHSGMQNDEKLTIKLINNFVKNNQNIYSEITKAIDDGDITLAHRLAHTLKGNAGLLEKTRLQKAAADVENQLSNAENQISRPLLDALKTELDAVLAEFAPLAAENAAGETKSGIVADDEQVWALFEELEALLDGGDVKCLNLIDRTTGLNLRSIPGTGELIEQIEYFEFDRAMKTLIRLKKGE